MSVCDEDVKIGGNGGPAGWLWGSDTMTHGPSYNSIFVLTCNYKNNFFPHNIYQTSGIQDKQERQEGRKQGLEGNQRQGEQTGDSGNRRDREQGGQGNERHRRRKGGRKTMTHKRQRNRKDMRHRRDRKGRKEMRDRKGGEVSEQGAKMETRETKVGGLSRPEWCVW